MVTILCNRYQILHEVESDINELGDAVEEEIPSYYYIVNRVGEYDSAGCIQEHVSKGNRTLNGILGPVVTYNKNYFRPVVGIVGENGWDIVKTLSMPELITPSVQVNIRAGRLPEPEGNGRRYLRVPLDTF